MPLQTVLPRLEIHPGTVVFKLREIVWDIGIHPVLNLPIDNEWERGENKTGQLFPLYTVIISSIF